MRQGRIYPLILHDTVHGMLRGFSSWFSPPPHKGISYYNAKLQVVTFRCTLAHNSFYDPKFSPLSFAEQIKIYTHRGRKLFCCPGLWLNNPENQLLHVEIKLSQGQTYFIEITNGYVLNLLHSNSLKSSKGMLNEGMWWYNNNNMNNNLLHEYIKIHVWTVTVHLCPTLQKIEKDSLQNASF